MSSRLLLNIVAILLYISSLAQSTPLPARTLPDVNNKQWNKIGWNQNDSGFINAVRDTNFLPRFAGTQIFRQTVLDSSVWVWNGARWTKSGSGGGNTGLVPAGPITSLATIGFTPATTDVAQWITNVFYQSQAPTSSISGGTTIELHSAGTFSATLNWTAGRQSSTQPIATIVVAGVNQTFSQPVAGASVNGTQNVTITYNTNIAYNNVVTTTDSKTSTSSTTFSFLPKRYYGFVSTTSPNDANIIASGSELTTTNAKTWTQGAPTGSQYLMYAYPANLGVLTHFDINGFPSIEAMTLTVRSFTNASGYAQSYNVYVSNNAFTVTGTTSIVAY